MPQPEKNANSEERRLEEDGLDATRMIDDTAQEKPDSQADPKQWIGRKLGRYEITDVLGMGGMGVVLKAHDKSIERDVAIKVLASDVSSGEKSLQRFWPKRRALGNSITRTR